MFVVVPLLRTIVLSVHDVNTSSGYSHPFASCLHLCISRSCHAAVFMHVVAWGVMSCLHAFPAVEGSGLVRLRDVCREKSQSVPGESDGVICVLRVSCASLCHVVTCEILQPCVLLPATDPFLDIFNFGSGELRLRLIFNLPTLVSGGLRA